jgi:integrase/recombinase XerC
VEHWGKKTHGGCRKPAGKGAKPAESQATLSAALGEFILYMRDEKQASPHTLIAYERDLLRFAAGLHVGDNEPALGNVTPDDVRGHMRTLLDRGLAKGSVRRAMYVVSSFLGWAYRWELIPSNPAARVTVPRRSRVHEVRALSTRERAILIAAADRLARESQRRLDQQAPLMVCLFLKTGIRRGELLRLCWRDIDLGLRELFVRHGKGDKSRTVPIEDKDLLEQLSQARAKRSREVVDYETSPVIVGMRGSCLPETTFYRIFGRVLAVAELDGLRITPHVLRHTFGSVLCARGVPVPYVMDLLGHEDIASTMIYVHTTPAGLREAVKKLRE